MRDDDGSTDQPWTTDNLEAHTRDTLAFQREAFREPAEVYADMAVRKAVEVRRLEPELRAARNLRDAAIRSAHAAGASQYALCKVTGLSRGQVQRICDLSKGA